MGHNRFDWTYDADGIVVYCCVSSTEVRDTLRITCPTSDHLPRVRSHYEPLVCATLLKAGAAFGEHWNFTIRKGLPIVSRVEQPGKWGTY